MTDTEGADNYAFQPGLANRRIVAAVILTLLMVAGALLSEWVRS